jgi:hypothetical protein
LITTFFLPYIAHATSVPINNYTYHYKNLGLNVGVAYAYTNTANLWGLGYNVRLYTIKKFATGINICLTSGKIADNFSFNLVSPYMHYNKVSILNQYDIIQKTRLHIGITIENGIAFFKLGDDNHNIKSYSLWGNNYKIQHIATDEYYVLEPGLNISYYLGNREDLFLTLKGAQRFVFGSGVYSTPERFNGYNIELGISIIGEMRFRLRSHKNKPTL